MQTFLIDYLHWIIYIYSQSISHLNKHILSQILSSSTALSTLNMQNIIMIETITFSKEYLLGPKSLQHKCFPNPKGEIQVAKYMQDKVIFYPHKEHTFQIKILIFVMHLEKTCGSKRKKYRLYNKISVATCRL